MLVLAWPAGRHCTHADLHVFALSRVVLPGSEGVTQQRLLPLAGQGNEGTKQLGPARLVLLPALEHLGQVHVLPVQQAQAGGMLLHYVYSELMESSGQFFVSPEGDCCCQLVALLLLQVTEVQPGCPGLHQTPVPEAPHSTCIAQCQTCRSRSLFFGLNSWVSILRL